MSGFVHILVLDGKGSAHALSPEELRHWVPESGGVDLPFAPGPPKAWRLKRRETPDPEGVLTLVVPSPCIRSCLLLTASLFSTSIRLGCQLRRPQGPGASRRYPSGTGGGPAGM